MRVLCAFFLLNFFSVTAQDTVITNYPSGALHSIEYRGESIKTRRSQHLPIRIVYNEDSTLYCQLFYDTSYGPSKRIWYENNIPVFGESSYCHNYFYENGELVRKTTLNSRTSQHKFCEEKRKARQYSDEKGTFKNFILHNGTISYYTASEELTSTIRVRNGYRQNDAVIYFKDSSLYRQVRNMPNYADLNGNRHIERSEASCITKLVIERYVKDFAGLQCFTNLEVINYLGNHVRVSKYGSFAALIRALSTMEGLKSGWEGNISYPMPSPSFCQCAKYDEIPVESQGEIYDFVQEDPQFAGGGEALIEWINTNLVVPENPTWDPDDRGRVYVSFVVEVDGSISQVKVVKSLSRSADSEAIRLMKSMPKWIPGRQDHVAVRCRMSIPITFKIP